MRLLGLGKAKEVKPLNNEMAVELGADMLSEVFVYGVASFTVYLEYRRQQRKDVRHEDSQNTRLLDIEQTMKDLELTVHIQYTQIQELKRLLLLHSTKLPDKIVDPKSGTILKVEKNLSRS